MTLAGTIEPNGSSGVEETLSYKEAMHPGFLRSHCAREQSPGSDASDCGRGCYKFRSDRGATAESDTSDDSETDDDDDDVVQLLWEEIKDNFLRDTDDYRSDNSVSSDDECLEKTYGHNHVPYMPVPSYVLLHRGMDETPMVLVPWTRSLTDDSGEPLPLPPKVWPPKPKLADVRARRDPMPRPRGTHTYQRKDNYVTRGERRRGPRAGSTRTPSDDDNGFADMRLGGHHHFPWGSGAYAPLRQDLWGPSYCC